MVWYLISYKTVDSASLPSRDFVEIGNMYALKVAKQTFGKAAGCNLEETLQRPP
jgi:hypothetical protein